MPQLVVHIRRDGEEQTRPAYAVWVSDTVTSVRAFGPEWEQAAKSLETALQSGRKGCGEPRLAVSQPVPMPD